MLLARSLRQRGATRLLQPTLSSPTQSRWTHYVPIISGTEGWSEQGIGNFMSTEQYRIAWSENQQRLVNGLNRLTDGGVYANSSTKQILLATARDSDNAQHFNYASMAHNCHFFFSTLSPSPTRPSATFGRELEDCFSSAASFRATFLATAEAMFGPGFVWLVQNTGMQVPKKYAILCTYIAGSPYPGAVFRRQERDMSTTPNNLNQGDSAALWSTNPQSVGFQRFGRVTTAPGGQDLTPLMCLSTWEHNYLHDYGVDGKRKYLERWWDAIDWSKVERNVVKPENISLSPRR